MDRPFREQVESNRVADNQFPFFEFFAGGGMARLGLGPRWKCVFANEWCDKKAASYRTEFGDDVMKVDDVANLTLDDFPAAPKLVWASFPCQDLSLAGSGAGLKGSRSGTFRPFWKLIRSMISANRKPGIVVLENVVGALTSHGGQDFNTIVRCLVEAEYKVGALVVDAIKFLPQSRPRLFIVGVQAAQPIPSALCAPSQDLEWHPKAIGEAYLRLPERLKKNWVWWSIPQPTVPITPLIDLIEDDPIGVSWHTAEQTQKLISQMSPLHLEKLEAARRLRKRVVGTIYRRTRPTADGGRTQRAEVRFDQISGCLRTPVGGSSRQIIIVVDRKRVRTRLLSPREAARLMGVPETYQLPKNYNDSYHLLGDGLAVPVVQWLSENLLTPLASSVAKVMAA